VELPGLLVEADEQVHGLAVAVDLLVAHAHLVHARAALDLRGVGAEGLGPVPAAGRRLREDVAGGDDPLAGLAGQPDHHALSRQVSPLLARLRAAVRPGSSPDPPEARPMHPDGRREQGERPCGDVGGSYPPLAGVGNNVGGEPPVRTARPRRGPAPAGPGRPRLVPPARRRPAPLARPGRGMGAGRRSPSPRWEAGFRWIGTGKSAIVHGLFLTSMGWKV
jgi:hypothetical protein